MKASPESASRSCADAINIKLVAAMAVFFAWTLVTRDVFKIVLPDMHGSTYVTGPIEFRLFLAVGLVACCIIWGLVEHAPRMDWLATWVGLLGAAGAVGAAVVASFLGSQLLFEAGMAIHTFAMAFFVMAASQGLLGGSARSIALHMLCALLASRLFTEIVKFLPAGTELVVTCVAPLVMVPLLRGVGLRMGSSIALMATPWETRYIPLVVGLAALGFAMGLFKRYGQMPIDSESALSLNLCAALFYALLVVVLLLSKDKEKAFTSVYKALMAFICCAAFVILAFGGWGERFSTGVLLGSQNLVMVLLWIVAPYLALTFRGRKTILYGWAFAVFYLASAFGGFKFEEVAGSSSASPVDPAHATAFLGACAVLFFIWCLTPSQVDEFAAEHHSVLEKDDRALAARCRLLARKFHLTEREEEIARLWVKGMTAGEIADVLVISSGTVRVHTRHVYEKTGTHARSDLFELLHDRSLDGDPRDGAADANCVVDVV